MEAAAQITGVPTDERFINRELSWLDFGARLLELAADDGIPLLERVKFLAIFAEGLDEFFQVRVAGLEDQVAADLRTRSPDGMRPTEQLEAITARVAELVERQSELFSHEIVPALAEVGLVLSEWHTLDDEDRAHLVDVFNRQIFPVLTPLAVDPGHPFPYISNLSLNLVVRVVDPRTGQDRIARVKVPPLLPRFVVLPDGERFVPLEQVIAAHLDTLFPSMTIAEQYAFRVTRNADVSIEEDEADDLLAAVELELQRRRFGQAVRLEAAADITDELLEMLVVEVDVPEDNVFLLDTPIDLAGLWAVATLDRPELRAEPWPPVTTPPLAGRYRLPRQGPAESRSRPPPRPRRRGPIVRARPTGRWTCSRWWRPATCCSTTPTTRSPPRSRRSSPRRPTIRGSWPSSRRSTGRRGRAPSSTR